MNNKILIFLAVVFFSISLFLSYRYFSLKQKSIAEKSGYSVPVSGNNNMENDGPKTEPCPLNGQLYSKSQRSKWESRRPLGIMVQNNMEARPQSGLSNADVVHEAVAEGGITRFLAIYYCESPKIVGSVRSARIYFVRLLQGFGNYPLYGHVGGANTPGPANALGEIKKLKWHQYNDLDQFAVSFPNYWRDTDRLPGRATEHTVYTNTEKLWEYAKNKRELTNVDKKEIPWDEGFEPWSFVDDANKSGRGTTDKIKFGFWDNSMGSDYRVEWRHDIATNTYLRFNAAKKHIDLNTDKQLSAKNVVIVFADEKVANDGYEHGQHLLYNIIGKDDAIVFQNGNVIEGTWRKPKADEMMRFYNKKGEEIKFVRGKIWIEILPSKNEVEF